LVLSVFISNINIFLKISFVFYPPIFHFIANKFRETFVMRDVGITFTKNIYDAKIREKYNL
jgi:hypothetical protein